VHVAATPGAEVSTDGINATAGAGGTVSAMSTPIRIAKRLNPSPRSLFRPPLERHGPRLAVIVRMDRVFEQWPFGRTERC